MASEADTSSSPPSDKRLPLVALLCLAFLIRLAFSISLPADEASLSKLPDQTEYLAIAKSLLSGGGFSFRDAAFDDRVYAYRMPGYPLLIAACAAKVTIIRIVQCVIDTSTILASYLLARRFLSGFPLWAGVCFVAFNPFLVFFSSLLLTETLFTSMLAWGLLAIISTRHTTRCMGMLIVCATVYVRPSAIGLAPVLVVIAGRIRGLEIFQIAMRTVAAMTLIAIMLLPWAARNRGQLGHWIWGTTNDGFTLYDGFNPSADGSSNQGVFREMAELKSLGEADRSQFLRTEAIEYIKRHPARAMELAALKLGRFWAPAPLSADFGGRAIYVIAGLVFTVPLFVFAIAGGFSNGIGRSVKLYLIAPAIYFSLVHALTVGSLRYRVPCDVSLAVLAGCGVKMVIDRTAARRISREI